MKNFRKGFTLLEILLVVGIIAILAAIVIVAINPSKQLAQARNTERKSDLKQINSALSQYYIDYNEYPTSLTSVSSLTEICDTGTSASSSELTNTCNNIDLINLSELVPKYLTAIPTDPSATTTSHAGYKIIRTGKKIGLSAPAELNQVITIGNVPPCEIRGDATDPDCWSTQEGQYNYYWSTVYEKTSVINETDGAVNTVTLVAIPGDKYPAAEYCYGLDQGGHQDWYLPSKDELWSGWDTAWGRSGGFPSNFYWSSTELSANPEGSAWSLVRHLDRMGNIGKDGQLSVRCLR